MNKIDIELDYAKNMISYHMGRNQLDEARKFIDQYHVCREDLKNVVENSHNYQNGYNLNTATIRLAREAGISKEEVKRRVRETICCLTQSAADEKGKPWGSPRFPDKDGNAHYLRIKSLAKEARFTEEEFREAILYSIEDCIAYGSDGSAECIADKFGITSEEMTYAKKKAMPERIIRHANNNCGLEKLLHPASECMTPEEIKDAAREAVEDLLDMRRPYEAKSVAAEMGLNDLCSKITKHLNKELEYQKRE